MSVRRRQALPCAYVYFAVVWLVPCCATRDCSPCVRVTAVLIHCCAQQTKLMRGMLQSEIRDTQGCESKTKKGSVGSRVFTKNSVGFGRVFISKPKPKETKKKTKTPFGSGRLFANKPRKNVSFRSGNNEKKNNGKERLGFRITTLVTLHPERTPDENL